MISSLAAPLLAALVKATLLFSAALLTVSFMRRSSAAARHAVCFVGLAAPLLFPVLSLLPSGVVVRMGNLGVYSSEAARIGAARDSFDWFGLGTAFWIAVTVALAARHLGGWFLVSRIAKRGRPIPVGASVPVLAAEVVSPLTFGLLRPVILVPREAIEWTESQWDAVLQHELAHVRRRDLWTNLLAAIATFTFWFHPLAWALARRLHEEQECACDDAVLSRGTAASMYAEVLISVAVRSNGAATLFACAMNGGAFRNRVAHVLDGARCRGVRGAVLARVVVGALTAVVALGVLQPGMRAADERVEKIGGDVQAPKLIHKVEPKYTDEARDAKIEGRVVLKVVVGSNGRITESTVAESLDPGLDRNALEAVQEWLFRPAMKKGEPVAVRAMIEVNFRLY